MTRTENTITLGDGAKLHKTTVRDAPSDGIDIARRRVEFMAELAAQSPLLHCGPLPYDTVMFVRRDGAWVAEAVAKEERGG